MRKALTAAAVERMKPPAKGQIEVFDRGYPGLLLRVSYGGGKAFGDVLQTRGQARAADARLASGDDPGRGSRGLARRPPARRYGTGSRPSPVKTSNTVATVVEEWIKRDKRDKRDVKPTTVYQIEAALKRDVLPLWGGREMARSPSVKIHELLDGIVDRAPGTARAVHSHLRSLFGWATGRDLISVNPMAGVEPPTKVKARDRVLSDVELVKVWHAAGADAYGPMVKLLILTGARREEITQLRWAEINDGKIELPAERTKTGEPRIIPLSPQAREILAGVDNTGERVFGVARAWPRAKARIDAAARINEPWVVHDLRRSLRNRDAEARRALQMVEAVLGHVGTRGGIVGVYQVHDYAEEKKAALEAWGAHVAGLLCRG